MVGGFHIARTLVGALARPLPVWQGPGTQARLSVVMRHQLRLGLSDLGKPLGQYLRKALVILLAGAP